MYRKLALLLIILTVSVFAFGQDKKENKKEKTDDKKDVIAVVNKLFDKMAEHKPAEIVALHTPEAQLVALIRQPNGTSRIQTFKTEQFSKNFAVKRGEIEELMYGHQIQVHGDLALVSGRYVFFVNGKISHCGVNAFHLVRTADGWRIGGASSTIEPGGCTDKEKAMKASFSES
jgi:hypothetical protein